MTIEQMKQAAEYKENLKKEINNFLDKDNYDMFILVGNEPDSAGTDLVVRGFSIDTIKLIGLLELAKSELLKKFILGEIK